MHDFRQFEKFSWDMVKYATVLKCNGRMFPQDSPTHIKKAAR